MNSRRNKIMQCNAMGFNSRRVTTTTTTCVWKKQKANGKRKEFEMDFSLVHITGLTARHREIFDRENEGTDEAWISE